ncbi:MAG: Rid family hydrolase, partial [Gemmatimonadota bacterium]
GQVVHVGDIEGQVHRMLLNVEQLLAGSGAGLGDVVRVTTYLKEPEFYSTFVRVCAERGFPADVPHTICHADVCRPDWLCEMELEAVFA